MDLKVKTVLSPNCAVFTSWPRAHPGKSEEIEPERYSSAVNINLC